MAGDAGMSGNEDCPPAGEEPWNGTFAQGGVRVAYPELVRVFGAPTHLGEMCAAEWLLTVPAPDPTDPPILATIYAGPRDRSPAQIFIWTVGGHDLRALTAVRAALDAPRTPMKAKEITP
jgi:hypothetical protein